MIPTSITVLVVQAFAKKTITELICDQVMDFLISQGKDLGKQEIIARIKKLREDRKLRNEVQAALEKAATRWAEDCTDRELVAAVAKSTQFTDLPSVREAILHIAQNPFDTAPVAILTEKFFDVLPAHFEPDRVKRGIGELLEILREEFISVTGLQDTYQLATEIQTLRASEETAKQTAITAENTAKIEAILSRLEKGLTPTEKTMHTYLSWVMDQHRYLDPRGTMQTTRQVQLKLDEIYVSLLAEREIPLSEVDRHIYQREVESLMAREDLSDEEKEDLRENLLAQILPEQGKGETSDQDRDLRELVEAEGKLVILGDPGSGKTTLLRYLAFQQAKTLRSQSNIITSKPETRLPIYLRISEYAEHEDGISLIDFLPYNVCGKAPDNDPLPRLLTEWLEYGQCLVLLDGLDEVIEPAQRGEIAGQINSFVRKYESKGNRFLVTSRVAGYRSAPLAGDIAHYRIQDMNDDQIKLFLTQWCRAVERFQTPDLPEELTNQKAQGEIDDISQSIAQNPGVRRLATNPLLLRTLALIHRTGSRLPARRIDLYRLAAETLIRDWELARGIPEAALVQESEATSLLAELAAWLHEEKPAGIATFGEVRQKLAEVKGRLDGKESDHPDVLLAVDRFLDRIRQHTGLFVERAPRRYGFMHLTFEEYFAARYLVAKPKKAAMQIRCRLHNPRWREPILLAIGYYGAEFPDDIDDLVEEAILGKELEGPSPYEDLLHRDLLFAIRVMGDQELGPMLRDTLIRRFINLWDDQEIGAGKFTFLEQDMMNIMRDLEGSQADIILQKHLIKSLENHQKSSQLKSIKILSHYASKYEVASVLVKSLANKNWEVRRVTAASLGSASEQPEVVNALLEALCDENDKVRSAAASSLRNATNQPKVVTALLNALHDESEMVRRTSAFSLGNATNQPEVVTALLNTLQDKNKRVRSVAASSLRNASRQPDAVITLLKALCDENDKVRCAAASSLRNASEQPEVVTALLNALHDENDKVRSAAASSLENATNQPEVVTALLNTLHDENDKVRRAAASSLRNASEQPEVVTALLNALHDESEEVRSAVARSLRNATNQPEVVTALLNAMHDENDKVCRAAANSLGDASEQPEVVTTLLNALYDESEEVRSSAAFSLENATNQPEVVTALLNALHDESEEVRSAAASSLWIASEQPEVVAALLNALHDESEEVRSTVASYLWIASEQPEIVTALLNALSDESEEVRSAAASSLRNASEQPEVVTALLNALSDESEEVRSAAASSLRNASERPEVITALLNALHDENDKVRRAAASSLRNASEQPEVVTALLNALHDESEEVRSAAASSLGDVSEQPETVTALLNALHDESEEVRSAAASSLEDVSERLEVVAALLNALHDESELVRSAAVGSLGDVSEQPEIVTALLNALHDESEEVRSAAASSLGDVSEQPEVVAALLNALYDESEDVCVSAATSLGTTSNQPEVVAALLNTLQDKNKRVRSAAASSLRNSAEQPEVVIALLNLLHDEKNEVRYAAATSLGNIKYRSELLQKIVSQLEKLVQLIYDPALSKRRYQRIKNNEYKEVAGCDFLFQLIQMYAPGPCR